MVCHICFQEKTLEKRVEVHTVCFFADNQRTLLIRLRWIHATIRCDTQITLLLFYTFCIKQAKLIYGLSLLTVCDSVAFCNTNSYLSQYWNLLSSLIIMPKHAKASTSSPQRVRSGGCSAWIEIIINIPFVRCCAYPSLSQSVVSTAGKRSP